MSGPFKIWAVGSHRQEASGRMSAYWKQILDDDPLLRDVVMVIDLHFGGSLGGKRIRVASQPVTSVSGTTGLDHSAVAALVAQPDIQQVYAVNEPTSDARSVTITISTDFIDPAALVLNGLPLFGYAEISLEPVRRLSGAVSDYDKRYVLLRGDIGGSGGPRFGGLKTVNGHAQAELMELQISDPRDSVQQKFPQWIIDANRFPDVIDSSQGERIPVVINGFENIPAIRTTTAASGITHRWIFAHGHTWDVNTTSGVSVNGVIRAAADASYGWTLVEAADGEGVPVMAIDFTNVATVWSDTDVVHVVTTSSLSTSYSVIDTIEQVLRRFSPFGNDGLSNELFSSARARMGQSDAPDVLVNASNSGTSALEWVEDVFLPSFPMISMIWSDGRYGPVVTDSRAPPVAKWRVGTYPLFDRTSLAEETPKSEIENDFTIRYDYDPLLDVYKKVMTRGALNSDICAYSEDVAGSRHRDPIASAFIQSDALAGYVIDWMVFHRALPSYYIECEGAAVIALRRRVGDTISITIDEYGWTDQPATIEGITIQRARCIVGLRVWVRYVDLGGAALSYS